jgi:phosphatidylserine decarboxylase
MRHSAQFFTVKKSRIHNRLPLAYEGFPFVLIALGLTVLFAYLGTMVLAFLLGVITLFVFFFFRDPERRNTSHAGEVLAPADGKVIEVTQGVSPLGEPAIKISIFMSIFNVHVNRISRGGTVRDVRYQSGKFFAADLDKASAQNERNIVAISTPESETIVIVQIAGLIARRIACWIDKGDEVVTGQRFGLIRFGSRLEVYLPEGARTLVSEGQKVRAGQTVIGELI